MTGRVEHWLYGTALASANDWRQGLQGGRKARKATAWFPSVTMPDLVLSVEEGTKVLWAELCCCPVQRRRK